MSRPPSGDASPPVRPAHGGTHAPGGDVTASTPAVDGIAIAAIVSAVGNVVFGSFLGLFLPLLPAAFALVSVALGHLALVRIRRTGRSGRGLARAALAVGYLGLVAFALMVCGTLMFTGYGLALMGF